MHGLRLGAPSNARFEAGGFIKCTALGLWLQQMQGLRLVASTDARFYHGGFIK